MLGKRSGSSARQGRRVRHDGSSAFGVGHEPQRELGPIRQDMRRRRYPQLAACDVGQRQHQPGGTDHAKTLRPVPVIGWQVRRAKEERRDEQRHGDAPPPLETEMHRRQSEKRQKGQDGQQLLTQQLRRRGQEIEKQVGDRHVRQAHGQRIGCHRRELLDHQGGEQGRQDGHHGRQHRQAAVPCCDLPEQGPGLGTGDPDQRAERKSHEEQTDEELRRQACRRRQFQQQECCDDAEHQQHPMAFTEADGLPGVVRQVLLFGGRREAFETAHRCSRRFTLPRESVVQSHCAPFRLRKTSYPPAAGTWDTGSTNTAFHVLCVDT
eukprot:Opistho-1_new@66590